MATVTSVELGASGNFIRFDDAAFDNLTAETWLFVVRPTAAGGGSFGYLMGKTPTGSINGPRLFYYSTDGGTTYRWNFSFHSSGTAGSPVRESSDGDCVIGRWHILVVTKDNSSTPLAASTIRMYGETADAGGVLTGTLTEFTYAASADGTGTYGDDSANPLFLMNRFGLGRELVGDWYAFLWDHVKTLTQINAIAADIVAETGGPLDDQTGMLLGWANQADLGPLSLTPASRSTFAAGTLPLYTNLGGAEAITGTGALQVDDFSYAGTGTVEGTDLSITGTGTLQMDDFTYASTAVSAHFFDDFDTSSMVVASSTIVGVGDATVFSMQPRNILTVAAPASARWLNIIGEIRGGIAGLTPIIEFKDYALWHPLINGTAWASTKRIWRSTWDHGTSTWGAWVQDGGAPTVGASTVRYTAASAFGSYRVRFATTIPFSIEEDETFLAALASSYPAAVKNALSNTSGFRSLLYSSQTTDLSEATGTEYSLSFLIDDDNQTNPSGAKLDFSVNAGVHGNEFQGKRMWRAFITRLMQAETKANYLRSVYRFHARPSLNPIGGDHGQWRGDWSIAPGETTQTTDLNRAATDNEPSNQLITHFQTLNSQDYAGRSKIAAMLDFHGDFGIAHTKFVAFFNTDEYPAIDFLRDRMEGYLGAGFIHDYGPSSNDSVEHAHRTVWGAPLALTFELTEISPRSDADFASVADALVQSLYDMVQAGELHFSVGTGALPGADWEFEFAGTGTASGSLGVTGTGALQVDDFAYAGTGTSSTPITGAGALQVDAFMFAGTGTASESIGGASAPGGTAYRRRRRR